MKIAIKGHPTRGKEVIKILKSLGGKNNALFIGVSDFWYFIDSNGHIRNEYQNILIKAGFKTYTLEGFEKEFPFKIGDKVTIIGLPDFPKIITKMVCDCDEILYSFEGLNNTWFGAKSLKKLEMKEERNITLTLDKAQEWYNKGGELREIALQAFKASELNPLPRSWEEFCKQSNPIASWRYDIPVKHEALYKLELLRDYWRQGWKPDWNDEKQTKYCIVYYKGKLNINILYETRHFLSFPTIKMAEEFLKCFRDLIEKAGDLI